MPKGVGPDLGLGQPNHLVGQLVDPHVIGHMNLPALLTHPCEHLDIAFDLLREARRDLRFLSAAESAWERRNPTAASAGVLRSSSCRRQSAIRAV